MSCHLIRLHVSSGYEEAAAQGLVAGVNAARVAAGSGVVTFPRENSYLGTLIDDLVTKVGQSKATRTCQWLLQLSAQSEPVCQQPVAVGISALSGNVQDLHSIQSWQSTLRPTVGETQPSVLCHRICASPIGC
jgi:hypothetical protein